MTLIPKLKNYMIEVLVTLGNSTYDTLTREDIKNVIVEKILLLDKPIFYLVNKYMQSSKILKEAYAKVIIIRLKDECFNFDDSVIDEILSLISLDDLIIHGANVSSSEIRKKCKEMFWVNSLIIEDASELNRKNAMYRRRVCVEKIKSERMIKNDKY